MIRAGAAGLLGCELLLGVNDFLFAYLDLVPMEVVQHLANLAREDGVGTWFSSTQALLVALVLAAVGGSERSAGRAAWGWGALAAFFAYIALDDGLEVHERVGSAVRRVTDSPLFDVFPTYAWQLVFAPLFGGGGLFMVVFLWRRLERALWLGICAALACFVVAVGLDFVEGMDGAFENMARASGLRTYTVSHGFKVTEELLEMLGTTLFLTTFAHQLAASLRGRVVVVR